MPRSSADLSNLPPPSRPQTGTTMRRAVLGVLRSFPVFGRDIAPRLYRIREIYGWHYGLRNLRRMSRRGWPEGGCRIVIGPAGAFDRPWIATDIEHLNVLDEGGWAAGSKPGSVDALLAEHVWEHLPPAEGRLAVRHCFKYLRPGGYLRAAVPDGHHPGPEYIEAVKVGGSGPSADDHKVLFTYETFSEVFLEAGFEVELLEYYDEHGHFSSG
jgi:predicted SAM-dependent methyltransferase